METHKRTILDQEFPGCEVEIPAGAVTLEGELIVPNDACGVVLFAHGFGSGRESFRDRFVAGELQRVGLATLLFNPLGWREEAEDKCRPDLRFNIPLLTERLEAATAWVRGEEQTRGLPVGYFGADAGAAAALIAAARRVDTVAAVVSRGGRPDLAAGDLASVRAPTLLIVGDNDPNVLKLNRQALDQLRCEKALEVVIGATHLFEEPGALAHVAEVARDWFARHLTASRGATR